MCAKAARHGFLDSAKSLDARQHVLSRPRNGGLDAHVQGKVGGVDAGRDAPACGVGYGGAYLPVVPWAGVALATFSVHLLSVDAVGARHVPAYLRVHERARLA
jgi:hypothetical protein